MILHFYFNIIIHITAAAFYMNFRSLELLMEGSSCFSCKAKRTVAVHTVGSDLELKLHIMKSQYFNGVCSYFSSLRENVDTVLRCFRIHISGGTQLLNRAHHTVGFDSAKFTFLNTDAARCHLAVMTACHTSTVQNNRNLVSFFDIRSTSNDLDWCFLSNIYLTDDQLICIRMFLNLLNLSDHDFLQIGIHFCKSFHLGA